MQFRLKHLFAIMLAFALLTVAVQFVVDCRPQFSGPILMVLAAPATMGVGILAFSFAAIMRQSSSGTKSTTPNKAKYWNLAGIGVFATTPLIAYIAYCCFVATPHS